MDATYTDEDLVYVDPDNRKVVGKVEWSRSGNAKKLERTIVEEDVEAENAEKPAAVGKPAPAPRRRKMIHRKAYYPWGTFRSMKKIFRVGEREVQAENYKTLDEAMVLAMEQPFWD